MIANNGQIIEIKDNPYFTSSLLGVRKPEMMAYQKVCWALNTPPDNCIYVDNLASNLHKLYAMGMDVVLFRRDGNNNYTYPFVRNFTELNTYLRGKQNA